MMENKPDFIDELSALLPPERVKKARAKAEVCVEKIRIDNSVKAENTNYKI